MEYRYGPAQSFAGLCGFVMSADLVSKDFEASGLPMILGNVHETRRATT
jgi:hypothetical protein